MTDKAVSIYVEDMFPSFYKEEGQTFIQFAKAYYEWMEQQNNVQYHINAISDDFDIDRTVDEFVSHFREQYLPSLDFSAETNGRIALKHSREFLATKGTEENIQLLMRLIYNQDAEVFRPSEKILRPSDGTWYVPTYLELTPSERTTSFIGRNVIGSSSGATALAERVIRKTVGGVVIDVMYLTHVRGEFVYKELITSDGNLDGCPRVVGSLSSIDLASGGKDFNVGDVVSVRSSLTGKGGLARVSAVGTATGRVTFDLVDGGYGFSANAIVYVADRMLTLSAKTANPAANSTNGLSQDFIVLEQVVQPLQTISMINVSEAIAVNTAVSGHTSIVVDTTDGSNTLVLATGTNSILREGFTVYGAGIPADTIIASLGNSSSTSNTTAIVLSKAAEQSASGIEVDILVANGYVVSVPAAFASNNQTIKVILSAGTFTSAGDITAAGGITGIVDTTANTFAVGTVIGITDSSLGIAAVSGTFTSNTPHAFVVGRSSNTHANVSQVSTGTGASFDIGSLTNTEEVFINVDRIAANNVYNIPFLDMNLSAPAFVDDVFVVNYAANNTHLYASGGGTGYEEGDIQALEFSGGSPTSAAYGVIIVADGVVSELLSDERGSGYSNGDIVVFAAATRTVEAAVTVAENTISLVSGNTSGLYVGLAVSGTGIPQDTHITGLDPEAGLFYISKNGTATTQSTLSFPARGYVTTDGSGALTEVVMTSQGSGYSTSTPPSVTIQTSGGEGAVVVAVVSDGVVVDTRVDGIGDGYTSAPTVAATTSGTPAVLLASTEAGYGFAKLPLGGTDTILADVLTSNTFTIGSIAGLTNISLGTGYNQSPEVLIIEPATVGFNRRDINITHDNPLNNFVVGELVTQPVSQILPLIEYTLQGEVDFVVGERVTQGVTAGIVLARESHVMTLLDVTGTFAVGAGTIEGAQSGATATVTAARTTTTSNPNKGRIKAVGSGYVDIERLSFNLVFAPGQPIVGSISGATANVINTSVIDDSPPIGFNADVVATAGVVAGFIKSVDIIDSGYAYKELEPVVISTDANIYSGTGYARLNKQGSGEGYFTSERGFLNGEYNYVHDNDYWQEYSYEVRTGISLVRYGDALKKACHVAGTKMFGSIIRTTKAQTNITASSQMHVGSATLVISDGTSSFAHPEVISISGSAIGYTDSSIYGSAELEGFEELINGSVIKTPNNATTTAAAVLVRQTFDGAVTHLDLTNITGELISPTGNIEAFTNTFILYVNDTAKFAEGDIVYSIPTGTLTASARTSRTTAATYRNIQGSLSTAAPYTVRPHYTPDGYSGILVEPSRTNVLLHSSDFANVFWANNHSYVVSNDVEDLFGGQTADLIKPTAEDAAHGRTASVTCEADQEYTLSAFFKQFGMQCCALVLPAALFGPSAYVVADVSSGTIIGGSGFIEPFAEGWYRVWVSAIAQTGGTDSISIQLATVEGDTPLLTFSPTSEETTNGYGLHVFGSQFEAGIITSLIPSGASPGIRTEDRISASAAGWSSGAAAGVVSQVLEGDGALAVYPLVRMATSNNHLVEGTSVFQYNEGTTVANSNVVFSSSDTVIASARGGIFSRYYGPLLVANAQMIYTTGNTTSIPSDLVIGERIAQGDVSGEVYDRGTNFVIVANTDGIFTTTSNSSTILYGETSGAAVIATTLEPYATQFSNISRTNNFVVGMSLFVNNNPAIELLDVDHNSNVMLSTVITPFNNGINKVDIEAYEGTAAADDVITGATSGATATITRIER